MEMGTMKMTMVEPKDKSLRKHEEIVEEYRMQVTDQNNHYQEPYEKNVCDKNYVKMERNQSRRKLRRYDHHHQNHNQPGHHSHRHDHDQYGGGGNFSEITGTDVPIDLSKRSVILSSTSNVDDDVQVSLQDERVEDSFDEPLNLSLNGKSSLERRRMSISCPRLNTNIGTSGGGGGGDGGGGNNPELLQKRVRLEEMVSYIRRCSNGKPEVEEDEDVHRTQVSVKRSYSYSQLETLNGEHADYRHQDHHHHQDPKSMKGTQNLIKKPKRLLHKNQLLRNTSESDSSYPVLRQQLLTVDGTVVTEPHSKSYAAGLTKEVFVEDLENDGDDEHEEEEEVEETMMMDQDDVDGRETRDNGEFLRHQLRLLSSGSPTGTCLPWSAYAYYANILQELQGSLNSSSNTTTSPLALPISLPLPLSLSTTTRSNSPLSDNGSIPVATLADGNGSAATFRKRAPRALTGKHVKHGTGASPATLLTLRQKIEQRNKNHHHNKNHQSLIKNDRKDQQHKTSKMNTSRKKITS